MDGSELVTTEGDARVAGGEVYEDAAGRDALLEGGI